MKYLNLKQQDNEYIIPTKDTLDEILSGNLNGQWFEYASTVIVATGSSTRSMTFSIPFDNITFNYGILRVFSTYKLDSQNQSLVLTIIFDTKGQITSVGLSGYTVTSMSANNIVEYSYNYDLSSKTLKINITTQVNLPEGTIIYGTKGMLFT